MNKMTGLYKRERCYFIKSGEKNYIFKKRLFGKIIKIELSGEVYIEKLFRFVRVFTDEALHPNQRKTDIVMRREHSKNISTLITQAGLIDYNLLLEERRRKKAEEIALKAQQMKAQAAEKISSAGNMLKGAVGGLFSRKKT